MMQDSYQRILLLHTGSFGSCWLVRNKAGEECVLKRVDLAQRIAEESTLNPAQEVKIHAQLKHPFIAALHDAFLQDECLCIVTAFAERGDLHESIQRQVSCGEYLPEPVLMCWFVQLSVALSYLHDQRILHRDIKPRNLLLSGPGLGVVKVTDFGMACRLEHEADAVSQVLGTPYYLSPERVREEPYTCKADVWSAGCVLYELAALRPAFLGVPQEMVRRILCGVPSQMPTVFRAEVRALASEMLTKDPGLRPSARQVLRWPCCQAAAQHLLQDLRRQEALALVEAAAETRAMVEAEAKAASAARPDTQAVVEKVQAVNGAMAEDEAGYSSDSSEGSATTLSPGGSSARTKTPHSRGLQPPLAALAKVLDSTSVAEPGEGRRVYGRALFLQLAGGPAALGGA